MNDYLGAVGLLLFFIAALTAFYWIRKYYAAHYRNAEEKLNLPKDSLKRGSIFGASGMFVFGMSGQEAGAWFATYHRTALVVLLAVVGAGLFLIGWSLAAAGAFLVSLIFLTANLLQWYVPSYNKESALSQTIIVLVLIVACGLIGAQFIH
jgi:hypothetical protein